MMNLLVTPIPQSVQLTGGTYTITKDRTIVLYGEAAQHGRVAARRLQAALATYAGAAWEVRAASGMAEREGVVAAIDHRVEKREGYHLTVGEERIGLVARDGAGLAHGLATLTQVVRQYGRRLPRLHIEDHPEFAHRGVMLDISRDKVPTMATLYGLVDMLAEWKVNQFQLYMEHTFAYERHRAVWKDASPMTGEEMLALDAYCRERNVELVANQNSFGHMARWLTKKPYNDFAECPRGAAVPWGKLPPFTLDPSDPRSLALIDELYTELLPHVSSRQINVGCDETFDLGQGKSKAACEKLGTGRVYLDFLLKIHRLCEKHGRRMMFWGDIVMQHPELIGEVPRDATALEWGYEHDHPYDVDTKAFRKAGLPFYVCPGTGSWISLIGRTDNAVANITGAATSGRANGAAGLLNTDWGDNGHMQPLPVSYLGFLYGAAMSWSPSKSAGMDLPRSLSLHAFDDPSGVTGRAAYDLGNVYQINGARSRNGTLPAQLYFLPLASDWPMQRVRAGGFEDTSAALAATAARIDAARMRRADAGQIVEEYACAVEMADIGAAIGAAKYARVNGASASKLRPMYRRAARRLEAVVPEYERLWLGRNRAGGMRDSVRRITGLAGALRAAAD
ncbi:MAG TPA: glycoside hydrolase family 20 zincin-like fold domain-containing protein [Dehalococcoidia bacterium]|nr:glycoside hydrolase family 20 zincin-like fold domain-containing protein [Dehalococcoidia bacterium]